MIEYRPRTNTEKIEGKEYHWIVLTGGPCSGKTTILSMAERELLDKGYKVFMVDEAASRIINSGIDQDYFDVKDFQNYIAGTQIANESIYQDVVAKCKYDKIVVICDRGLLDGKAYMDHDDFAEMLKSYGTDEVTARDSYDGVIFLVTAAKGAEKNYSLKNNKARKETIEEAREIDTKTLAAWTTHPHLSVIDNSTGFAKKKARAMAQIYNILGSPVPIDTYKKYLIEMPDFKKIRSMNGYNVVEISRTYLMSTDDNHHEKSVTKRTINGMNSFYYMERQHYKGFDRIDVERRIDKNEYRSILGDASNRLKELKKTRHCFTWEDKYYEIDVLPLWNEKAILKIQLTDKGSTFEVPSFLTTIKDVSDNPNYTSFSLAQNIN